MIICSGEMAMKFPITTLTIFLFLAEKASAHMGHLGELAGHAHWVGLGAIIVAGAIAAAAASMGQPDEEESIENEEEAEIAGQQA